MRVQVSTSGFADLERALLEFKPATAKAVLRRAGIKALEPMAAAARRLAPDDPKTPAPDLHTSIDVSSKQKSGRAAAIREDGPNTVTLSMGPTKDGYPQALPQEFGTKDQPAHPFMRPAWDAGHTQLLEDVQAELTGEIARASARAAARAAQAAALKGL